MSNQKSLATVHNAMERAISFLESGSQQQATHYFEFASKQVRDLATAWAEDMTDPKNLENSVTKKIF